MTDYSRRGFLAALGAAAIASRPRPAPAAPIVVPPLSRLEAIGSTGGKGFFSLLAAHRHLLGGTYGPVPVECYAWNGRDWFLLPGGALPTVGESLFAMCVFSRDGQAYGATESTGKTVRFEDDGWHVVFQAPVVTAQGKPTGWNNSYSILEYRPPGHPPHLVTGFNAYPDNDRSLLVWSADGVTWNHKTIHGMHHPRFATNGPDLFIAWVSVDGHVEIWNQALARVATLPGAFTGQPCWWQDALYVPVEPGEGRDVELWRLDRHGAARVAVAHGQAIGPQLQPHERDLYWVTGVRWRADAGHGRLYRSRDGLAWEHVLDAPEPEVWAAATFRDELFIGGRRELGGGGAVYRVVP